MIKVTEKGKIIVLIALIIFFLLEIISGFFDTLETISSGKRLEAWKFVFYTISSGTFFAFLYAAIFVLLREIKKRRKK